MEVESLESELLSATESVEVKDSYMLGSYICNLIQTLNPDMILGHELLGVHLPSILEFLSDAQQMKIPKITSSDIKRNLRSLVKYRIKSIFTGRLLCDTFGLSKENLRIDNYDLVSMSEKYLKVKDRPEIYDHMHSKSGRLIMKVRLVFELAENFEFLELTSELSKIAGCLWAVSLRSSRAKRNEMLLMHYFWRDNYIGIPIFL